MLFILNCEPLAQVFPAHDLLRLHRHLPDGLKRPSGQHEASPYRHNHQRNKEQEQRFRDHTEEASVRPDRHHAPDPVSIVHWLIVDVIVRPVFYLCLPDFSVVRFFIQRYAIAEDEFSVFINQAEANIRIAFQLPLRDIDHLIMPHDAVHRSNDAGSQQIQVARPVRIKNRHAAEDDRNQHAQQDERRIPDCDARLYAASAAHGFTSRR